MECIPVHRKFLHQWWRRVCSTSDAWPTSASCWPLSHLASPQSCGPAWPASAGLTTSCLTTGSVSLCVFPVWSVSVCVLPVGQCLCVSYHWVNVSVCLTTGSVSLCVLPLGQCLCVSYQWVSVCVRVGVFMCLTIVVSCLCVLPVGQSVSLCVSYQWVSVCVSYQWVSVTMCLASGSVSVCVLPVSQCLCVSYQWFSVFVLSLWSLSLCVLPVGQCLCMSYQWFSIFVCLTSGWVSVCVLTVGPCLCLPLCDLLPQWLNGKASALGAGGPRIEPQFSQSSHTIDFKSGTVVAALPGAWQYRVNAVTGWPGVSYCN